MILCLEKFFICSLAGSFVSFSFSAVNIYLWWLGVLNEQSEAVAQCNKKNDEGNGKGKEPAIGEVSRWIAIVERGTSDRRIILNKRWASTSISRTQSIKYIFSFCFGLFRSLICCKIILTILCEMRIALLKNLEIAPSDFQMYNYRHFVC